MLNGFLPSAHNKGAGSTPPRARRLKAFGAGDSWTEGRGPSETEQPHGWISSSTHVVKIWLFLLETPVRHGAPWHVFGLVPGEKPQSTGAARGTWAGPAKVENCSGLLRKELRGCWIRSSRPIPMGTRGR